MATPHFLCFFLLLFEQNPKIYLTGEYWNFYHNFSSLDIDCLWKVTKFLLFNRSWKPEEVNPPAVIDRKHFFLEDMFKDIYTLVLSVWYFLPPLPPLTAVFSTHSSVLYSPNMLLDTPHSPSSSTSPYFPPRPPPLLSIPPSLQGSGVSNQCLSCLIPSRCRAAVRVSVSAFVYVSCLIVVSLYLIQTWNKNEGSQGKTGRGRNCSTLKKKTCCGWVLVHWN